MATNARSRKRAKVVHNVIQPTHAPARAVNSKGFAVLPTELLLEIFSYLPSMPIPAQPGEHHGQYRNRARILRGLSQMCRSLRSVFLPIVWEKIEVFVTFTSVSGLGLGRRASRRSLAKELLRQLEVVTIRDPTLAAYVKIVNVIITDYSSSGVMEEFARCLALFKNLETIQILEAPKDYVPPWLHFLKAFEIRVFPSVRTVVIPEYATEVLKSCTGARFVTCTSPLSLDMVKSWCPKIQTLTTCHSNEDELSWHVIKEVKEGHLVTRRILLEIFATGYGTHAMRRVVNSFRGITRLSCITIQVPGNKVANTPRRILSLVKQADELLQQQALVDGLRARCVLVVYRNGTSKFLLNQVPPLETKSHSSYVMDRHELVEGIRYVL